MKRLVLLLFYTIAVLGTFHITATTEFPLPTIPTPEVTYPESKPTVNVIIENEFVCTELGIPLKDFYPQEKIVSKSPWDIKVFDGKVFIGCGDYDKNTGPSPVFYYDLRQRLWVNSGTLNDESIAQFTVIDGKLIIPGIDPKTNDDFSFGNYYVYSKSGWTTVSNVPNAVHMYDIKKFQSETFYAIGTSNETHSPVQKTADGQTFADVPFLKEGKPITQNSTDTFSRCYALFTVNDKLYAFCRWFESGFFGFFEYDGNAFNLICEKPTFEISPQGINRQSLINEHVTFNGKGYFSLGTLYSTSDFKSFNKITVPENAYVEDLLVKEDRLYVLTSQKQDSPLTPTSLYKNTVWEYSEENGFIEILSFEHNTTAMSFDICEGSVYIGLGNYKSPTEYNGTVLELRWDAHTK